MSIEEKIIHWHKFRNKDVVVNIQHFLEEGLHLSSNNSGISIGGHVPTQIYQDNNSIVLQDKLLLNSEDEIVLTSNGIALNSENLFINNRKLNNKFLNRKTILSSTSNLDSLFSAKTKIVVGEADVSKGQLSIELSSLFETDPVLNGERKHSEDEIMSYLKKALLNETNN